MFYNREIRREKPPLSASIVAYLASYSNLKLYGQLFDLSREILSETAVPAGENGFRVKPGMTLLIFRKVKKLLSSRQDLASGGGKIKRSKNPKKQNGGKFEKNKNF